MSSINQQVKVLEAIQRNSRREPSFASLGFTSSEEYYKCVENLKKKGLIERGSIKAEKSGRDKIVYLVYIADALVTNLGKHFLNENK